MLIHAPVFSGESLTLIHTPVVDWGVHNKKKTSFNCTFSFYARSRTRSRNDANRFKMNRYIAFHPKLFPRAIMSKTQLADQKTSLPIQLL